MRFVATYDCRLPFYCAVLFYKFPQSLRKIPSGLPEAFNALLPPGNCQCQNQRHEPFSAPYSPLPCSYQLRAVRTQQKSYLDSILSQKDYDRLKEGLSSDQNMEWYFLVHFLGSTGMRIGELIQMKLEHLQLNYMDLYSKGGKVRRIYFPDKLCREAILWYSANGKKADFSLQIKTGSL